MNINVIEFRGISESVIENIFNPAGTLPANAAVPDFAIGNIVASLRFFGDISGHITLAVRECDVPVVTDLIIKRFGIGLPVADELVFAELINMFAGNIVTELSKRFGMKLSITAPDTDFSADHTLEQIMTVRTADKTVYLKFNYNIIKDNSDEHNN